MSRRFTPLVLAAALSASGAIAAQGEGCRVLLDRDTGAETGVEVCTQPVWFHAGDAPLGNLSAAATSTATFDANEPSQGGAYVTTSALHQQVEPHHAAESARFVGTFDGALDNVLVTMYLLPPAGVAQGENFYRVDAQLTIDGEVMMTLDDKNVPMETAGNQLQVVTFGWVNIDAKLTKLGIDLAGEHEIALSFHGTGIGTNGAVVFFDHAEAPGGMVFNVPLEEVDDKLMGRA